MIIRVCSSDDDIREVAILAKKIWNEYFIAIISQTQIDYMVAKFQSYEAIKKAIEMEAYTYFIAYENNEIIGYCGVKEEKQRLFLSKLYLQKNMRGKGFASVLLQKALSFAKEKNKQAVYLTCNKYNAHSLAVYEQKGFYKIDAVQNDIGNGYIMDDYILQLDL